MVMKRPSLLDSTWTTFTEEFSLGSWGACGALFLACPLLLYAVTHASPTETERMSLQDSFIMTVGAITFQGKSAPS